MEIIERELVYGFMEEDELLEEVLDMFVDEDVDATWIGEQVTRSYAKRMAEVDEWDPEEVNDFDRIANAFDELNEQRVIALHRSGYTEEDGIGDVTDAFKALAEAGVRPRGYVFYTGKQLERAIDPDKPVLVLSFGALTKANAHVREVGNLIVATLLRYGLEVRWSGNPGDRIKILELDWQKEPDDEDWGVERAVAIMTGQNDSTEEE